MKIAVHDASILIDLIKIDMIEQALALDFGMHTTDFIINELNAEQRSILLPLVSRALLTIDSLSGEEVALVQSFTQKYVALSVADCSVLLRARQLSGIVLTGDKQLRTIAQAEELEVHGILWILDKLIEAKLLSHKQAASRLERLQEINQRLPQEECEKRLKEWRRE